MFLKLNEFVFKVTDYGSFFFFLHSGGRYVGCKR